MHRTGDTLLNGFRSRGHTHNTHTQPHERTNMNSFSLSLYKSHDAAAMALVTTYGSMLLAGRRSSK
jgi:hypothetical protein